ncbi:MAG: type II secretion system F family protein [Verrucomicrobiae bacterium]|nr:type II secretion system F family protein [Verrucomicrobiae bacterium]
MSSQLKARGFFYSELAKFARAGFGIDRACESIAGQSGSDRIARGLCRSILSGLNEGKSLAESMRTGSFPVSDLEVAMVDAAERGGKLEVGFRHLADHFKQEAEAKRRIRRAMIYPVFLLHFAVAVGIGITALLRQVNPNSAEGSGISTVVTGLIWLGIGYGVAIVLAIAWNVVSKAAERSSTLDALMQRVPLAGPVRRSRALARFCEVLHIYWLSGQRMDIAWSRAGAASQSGQLLRYSDASALRLANGESVSEVVMSARGALPGDFVRGIASADVAGALDEEAGHWAEYYREAAGENLQRFAEWMPKLFYWLVLLFAAGMIIRVALSYRDLLNGILNGMP